MLELPWRQVHFTGIGGVGMTGLALILRDAGVAVSGTDEVASKNLELLRARGCTITVGHAASHVPAEAERLVYSSAVQPENPERRVAAERGLPDRSVLAGVRLVAAEVVALDGVQDLGERGLDVHGVEVVAGVGDPKIPANIKR